MSEEVELPAPGSGQARDDNGSGPQTEADGEAPPLPVQLPAPRQPVVPSQLPAPQQPEVPSQLPAPREPSPSLPAKRVLPSDLAEQAANARQRPKRRWKRWCAVGAVAAIVAGGLLAPIGAVWDRWNAQPETIDVALPVTEPLNPDLVLGEAEDRELSPVAELLVRAANVVIAYNVPAPVEVSVPGNGEGDGSVWNVRVSPPRDITSVVLSSNSFNDSPPDGVRFVGFDVEMTLAAAREQPLAGRFFLWEIFGGVSATGYRSSTIEGLNGCGAIPNRFDPFDEVFVSGTLAGTVCIPLPMVDLGAAGTQISLDIAGEKITFGATGRGRDPAPIAEPSAVARGIERGFGAAVPVAFGTTGDDNNGVWNITVESPRDVGQRFAADSFNDPPPDGVTYMGFDVEVTLASTNIEPLAPSRNLTWELLGGATARVYEAGTLDDLFGCGSSPNDFNRFAEVFAGGTFGGLVCIPIPTEDVGHPDTQVAINVSGERIVFTADGPTPAPAPVEFGAGAGVVGSSFPLDESVEVEWDALGEADGSIWTTTLSNWRDMTAEVMAEYSFNDMPPPGIIFVGFDAELTLVDADVEPLNVAFNFVWEILGAETRRIYEAGTVPGVFGCGITPNEFDQFAEVLATGTVSGTVCIPLPASDFADPDTQIALRFREDRVTFSPTN